MKPAQRTILNDLISLFHDASDAEVVRACENHLANTPDDVRVLEILGLTLSRAGNESEAVAVLEKAWRLAPDDPQISYNLAVTYQAAGDDRRAMLRYRDCLRASPDHRDGLWNYGELLRVNDYFDRAAACFTRLRDTGRIYPDLYHRLAVCLAHLGRDEEARAAFEAALDGNSSDPALTHWEYAHFLLSTGDFANGFAHYDHRFDTAHRTSVRCHPFERPAWRGEPLTGKTILVHGEQGLGDEIMFCSVVPELAVEADRIFIACQPPLVRLFSESFPGCTVLPHRALVAPAPIRDADDIDAATAMGSLCRYRRRGTDDFSASAGGYLRAGDVDRRRFGRLVEQRRTASGEALTVGIMWGSNPAHGVEWGARRAAKKSIPASMFDRLAGCGNIRFVSLQNRDNGADAAFAAHLDPIDFSDELLDLADTAALISNLDLVISVDTSIAHLAGAMGKPVWILLVKDCDWRWGRNGDSTPWYDSARLFRQQTAGDWRPVLDEVAEALAGMASTDARASKA